MSSSRPLFLAVSSATLLSFTVLMGAGCTGGGTRPTPTPSDPTAIFGDPSGATTSTPADPLGMSCNHEYYPLRMGYHIQYETTYPASSGISGSAHYALNVRRVTPTSVYLTSAFERSTGSPGSSIQSNVEYRCIGGALAAAGYVDMGPGSAGGANRVGEIHTNSSEGEFLPRHIEPGSQWAATFNVTMTLPATPDPMTGTVTPIAPIDMNIAIKRQAVRVERVRVPAGEYEAMKVTSVTLIDNHPATNATEWWVKDVGMVKSTADAGSGVQDIVTVATGVTVPRP